jgi:hypothetical protein
MPFDLVSQTVQANDEQRSALERVRSTANDAAETLAAACPKDTPAELGQRLDQLGRALDSRGPSLALLLALSPGFYQAADEGRGQENTNAGGHGGGHFGGHGGGHYAGDLPLAEKDSGAADPRTTGQFLAAAAITSSTASWLQGPARTATHAEHNGRASRVLRVTAKRKRGE